MRKMIITFFILNSIFCYGQNSYVEFDTVRYTGAKTINQGKKNFLICRWETDFGKFSYFTPFQVKAYSVINTEFVAKDVFINGKEERLFLEKISTGKLTLFYLDYKGDHFFIEKDGELLDLKKQDVDMKTNYKDVLRELCSDCGYVDYYLKHTRFNRYFMKRFSNWYNQCQEVYTPIRFGVIGGWNFAQFTMLQEAWRIWHYPTDRYFTFGAFGDFPVLKTNFSIHPEISYSKQTYSSLKYIANIETLHLPLLFRYTSWKNKWSPFMNIGGTWNYYSRLESSELSIDSNIRKIELSPSKFSMNGGVGIWYRISKRNAIFVEARITYNMDWHVFNIFAGINI